MPVTLEDVVKVFRFASIFYHKYRVLTVAEGDLEEVGGVEAEEE
jgi:hypothetical protein